MNRPSAKTEIGQGRYAYWTLMLSGLDSFLNLAAITLIAIFAPGLWKFLCILPAYYTSPLQAHVLRRYQALN